MVMNQSSIPLETGNHCHGISNTTGDITFQEIGSTNNKDSTKFICWEKLVFRLSQILTPAIPVIGAFFPNNPNVCILESFSRQSTI